MVSILCVLRAGGDYTPEYVHILRDSVRRHWPEEVRFRFACLTDFPKDRFDPDIETFPLLHKLPGWWAKMELFNPSIDAKFGDRLYFDLDTAITGPLASIVAYSATDAPFTILRDFYRPQGYGSGVMFIPRGFGMHVWDNFMREPHDHTSGKTGFRGDQDYLERAIVGAARWQDVCPGKFYSFKPAPIFIQGRPATLASLPKGAAVVCFHGFPRPPELPADHWIRQHWRRETLDEHVSGIEPGKTGTDDL